MKEKYERCSGLIAELGLISVQVSLWSREGSNARSV